VKKSVICWLMALALLSGLSLMSALPALAYIGDFYVSDTRGQDNQTGTAAHPWKTIQHAINSVTSNQTIHVENGTYCEQLTITKALTLVGESQTNTTVYVPSSGRSSVMVGSSSTDYVLAAYPSDWETTNFTGTQMAVKISGFTFNADNLTGPIGEVGVYFGAVGAANIANAGLFNCTITGISDLFDSGDGIDILGNSKLTLDHNTIYYTSSGIYVSGQGSAPDPQLRLTHNTLVPVVYNDWESAIWFETGASGLIDNNTINHGSIGIAISDSENPTTISNNTITDMSGDDSAALLFSQASLVTVTGNELTDNDLGVDIDDVDNLTFTGNTIGDNSNGVHIDNSPAHSVIFHNNNIAGNTHYGLADFSGSGVDFTDNWWGSANGPEYEKDSIDDTNVNTFNMGFQGNTVTGSDVDYVPWLDAAYPGGVSFAPVSNGSDLYSSIQTAVLDAADGESIHALAGTFTEQVLIPGDLNLIGAGKGVTTILAPESGRKTITVGHYSEKEFYDYILAVCPNDWDNKTGTPQAVKISGFTFDVGAENSTANRFCGVVFCATGAEDVAEAGLFDCEVKGFNPAYMEGDGVDIVGPSRLTIDNNTLGYTQVGVDFSRLENPQPEYLLKITRNTLDYIPGGSAFFTMGYPVAIVVVDNTACLVDHNVMTHGNFGIALMGGDNCTISDNTISHLNLGVMAQGNQYLTIDNNTISQTQCGMLVEAENSTISNNNLSYISSAELIELDKMGWAMAFMDGQDNLITGNTLTHSDIGWFFNGIENSTFTGNTLNSNLSSVYIQAARGLTFNYNNFFDNTHLGFISEMAELFNAENNWWGSANGPTDDGNTYGLGYQGDNLTGNVDYVPWLDAPNPTGASFTPVNNFGQGSQFASIQAAIDAADPGDILNISAGVFTENVTVNKSVNLEGAGQKLLTVIGPGDDARVFSITDDDVSISGLTARGENSEESCGVMIDNGVQNCRIEDCTLTGNDIGLVLGFESHDNNFVNDNLTGNYAGGCALVSSANNTFTDSQVNSNGLFGFLIDNCTNTTLVGNTVNLNGDYGLYIEGGRNFNITGNTFNANAEAGIRLTNAITNLTIKGNQISNNGIGIEVESGASGIATWIVAYNNIEGNHEFGVSNPNLVNLLAENDWWGAANGPYNPPSYTGSGDNITDYVNAVPYLDLPYGRVETQTGLGVASFRTSAGVIENLTAVSEEDLPTLGKPEITFPFGLFSFRITGLELGETVVVTITLPEALPGNSQYWQYNGENWVRLPLGSNNGDNVITLTLTDGGTGDGVSIPDGEILDPSGPGIGKENSSTIVELSSNSIMLSQSMTVDAAVWGTTGGPVPTGLVSFQVISDALGSTWSTFDNQTLQNGKATSIAYTPGAKGSFRFRAIYNGNKYYLSSQSYDTTDSLYVNKGQTVTKTLLSYSSIKLGESVNDEVSVSGLGGDFPSPTGTVNFQVSFNGGTRWVSYGTRILSKGRAISEPYTPNAVGNYLFRVVYNGDANYYMSQSNDKDESLTVGKAQSTTTTKLSSTVISLGSSFTDSAFVVGLGSTFPTPTGTVNFQVSADNQTTWTTFNTKTLSSGKATSISYKPTTAGYYYFRAVYEGNTNYFGSQSANDAELVTMNRGTAKVATRLSVSSLSLGNGVTDTATVTISNTKLPKATGTVTFQYSDDNAVSWNNYDTRNLSSGKATSKTFYPLKSGKFYFRAIYNGDINYNSAQSANKSEPLTVKKGKSVTTTELSAAAIPVGDSVTDNVTVAGPGVGYITPTGTVRFQVSSNNGSSWTTYDTRTLTNGTATSKSYKPAAKGKYYFRVVYVGDTNYNTSQSANKAELLIVQ
jgi:parallel beta-helix repeat protein